MRLKEGRSRVRCNVPSVKSMSTTGRAENTISMQTSCVHIIWDRHTILNLGFRFVELSCLTTNTVSFARRIQVERAPYLAIEAVFGRPRVSGGEV
jgi:hypothetical protein